MTHSNASIRRAIAACSHARPATIQAWSASAVDRALDKRQDAATDADKALYLAIDSVAYGIRWAETTGRTTRRAYHQLAWKDTRSVIEAIVRLCLRTGDTSADFVKECWKDLAELRERHLAETA